MYIAGVVHQLVSLIGSEGLMSVEKAGDNAGQLENDSGKVGDLGQDVRRLVE